ncbi:hypothetical protein N9E52_01795 [Alphaproteobacteria bacterium]|nr:hypothetical protein [Alphaproteobacteria bacterium]
MKKVGWFIDNNLPGDFIYNKPQPIKFFRDKPLSKRAVQSCPAVNNFERNYFQVSVPYDLRLRVEKQDDKFNLFNIPDGTRIDEDILHLHITLMRPEDWRDKNRPIVQIKCPYVFITDDDIILSQLPPFLDFKSKKWPGLLVAGKFPIIDWPRTLSWAFEWHDLESDLILKRGDPWFYVYFESDKSSEEIQLVDAENNEVVKNFRKGMAEVVKYVSNSFSLFKVSNERRPKQLLFERSK